MKTWRVVLSLVLLLVLAACNLPRAPKTPSSDQVLTSSASTVEAQLTEHAKTFSPPETTTLTIPPTVTLPASTLPPPPTVAPPPTSVPPPCDRITFVADITIPDGTALAPAQAFTKTWRLQNAGSCTWNSSYAVVFDSGNQMGAQSAYSLPGTVAPGQTVDISINMTAPTTPGSHRGYWRLRNPSGVVFGLTNGSAFYVDIKVIAPTVTGTPPATATPTATTAGTTLVYDFVTNFCAAQWETSPPTASIPCPGVNDDPEGFVVQIGNPTMENGSAAGKPAIQTHPKWVDNGVIQGKYPPLIIASGSRFRATIGCLQGGAACDVNYSLNYYADGSPILQTLGSWHEVYDGSVVNLDLPLNTLAGKSVQFVLMVHANGSSAQDWALWVDAKIVK